MKHLGGAAAPVRLAGPERRLVVQAAGLDPAAGRQWPADHLLLEAVTLRPGSIAGPRRWKRLSGR